MFFFSFLRCTYSTLIYIFVPDEKTKTVVFSLPYSHLTRCTNGNPIELELEFEMCKDVVVAHWKETQAMYVDILTS